MVIEVDISIFNKINILDSCAVSNILSCNLFYSRAIEHNCSFAITQYVEYECLIKPRTYQTAQDIEIQNRLKRAIEKKQIKSNSLSIDDIQESEVLKSRKNLGMGELSSIAFAKKIGHAFLTDDMGARTFAKTVLGKSNVQTTTHLLGFLFFEGILSEGEIDPIVTEHNSFGRPLEKYFRIIFAEALRVRFINQQRK